MSGETDNKVPGEISVCFHPIKHNFVLTAWHPMFGFWCLPTNSDDAREMRDGLEIAAIMPSEMFSLAYQFHEGFNPLGML
jgi:hypothetical protein